MQGLEDGEEGTGEAWGASEMSDALQESAADSVDQDCTLREAGKSPAGKESSDRLAEAGRNEEVGLEAGWIG
eukprot:633355-Hanusia_phi.AAC.1